DRAGNGVLRSLTVVRDATAPAIDVQLKKPEAELPIEPAFVDSIDLEGQLRALVLGPGFLESPVVPSSFRYRILKEEATVRPWTALPAMLQVLQSISISDLDDGQDYSL